MEKTRWSAMDQGWWTEWKEGIVCTLGHDWPLLTNKKSASRGKSGCPTSAAMRTAAA